MAISSSIAAGIMAVVSTVSAVASGVGMIMQSNAASAQAKQQQKALELQGQVQLENSKMAAAEKRTEAQRIRSTQVVAGASAGIDLGSQSFESIMLETSQMYEKDAQQIEASGRLNQAATTYSASAYDTDQSGAYIGAAGSVLKGLGTSYYYGDKAGWFN